MTTREDLPELWGVSEIVEFTNAQLAEAGRPPMHKVSVAEWCRLKGFPEPAFDLRMGTGWVRSEVEPWVLDRIARSRGRRGGPGNGIDPQKRAAIAAARGSGRGLRGVAADFGVGYTTVSRIWGEQKREERTVE